MTRHTLKIAALRTLLLLTLIAIAGVARANTYYIDYAAGSNSNAGTSEGSSWKSAPGMQTAAGCAGATHTYTHLAGDTFIFKGGVTWPAACFPMNITQGGSSNTIRDTYTVDQTWFTGGSFTKPIFAGQNVAMDGMILIGASNINLSHLDIGGWKVTTVNGAAMGNCDQATIMVTPGNSNVTASFMYLHDWLVPAAPTHASGVVHGITSGGMCLQEFHHNNITLSNSEVSDFANTVSGVQTSVGACGTNVGLWYDHCHDLYEGIVGHETVHDNEMNHISWPCSGSSCGADSMGFSGINHTNIFESGTGGGDGPVYNNYIHDDGVFGEVIDECMNDAVYNNVISNVANIPIRFQTCGGDSASTVTYVYNNTVDESICQNRSGGCPYTAIKYASGDLSTVGKVNGQNNITIGASTNFAGLSGSIVSNNRTMASAEAATYGFIAGNKFAPSSSDPSTSGQGVNLTFSCSGLTASLCQDASGTPWFGGAYKTRQTGSTPWDMGAFLGQGGSGGPPTISISAPSPGTISGSVNLTASCTPQGSATVSSIQFTIDGFPFGAAGTSSPYTLSWNTITAANANHVIGASCTDSNAQVGTAGTVTVTVSNSIPGCFISTDNGSDSLSWTANQAFTAQSANFTATVTITPNTPTQDSVFALSQAPMNVYGQGAAVLRANSSGFWDVWKGSTGYTSDNSAPYTAGTAYSFTFTINFTGPNAGTFSLSETSPSSIAIATNYAFRATASIASLGFINSISDNDTPDTAKVCNFQVGSATSLTFSPTSLSFGNVTETASSTLPINTSTSGGAVTFSSAVLTGSTDFSIGSNTCTGSVPSSCSTAITFAPTAAGLETATLTYTDSATGSPQTISLSGTGVAPVAVLTFVPSPLAFGNVTETNTASLSIAVSTAGASTTFSSVGISGNADFSISGNTCTGTVATNCSTTIHFTPTGAGAESATVTYTDNASGSPQTVSVTGTGVALPSLSFSPSPLPFGNVTTSTTASLTITTTTSGGSVTFSSVILTGASDFSIFSNTCTGAVASSCTTVIHFTPTSAISESGTLTYTDTATGSPQTVSITGTGVAPAATLAISPSSLAFGNITVLSNSSLSVTGTTTGGSVSFTSVVLTGSTDFSIFSNSCTGSVASLCSTVIKFTPSSGGTKSGMLTYTDAAAGSPQTVSLSGTGIVATPTISIAPLTVTFGNVQIAATAFSGPIVLTITSGPVTFTGTPSLSGPNAADFAVASNTCTGTVSAASCQSVVSFTPSLVAAESATLTYTDNATGSPQTVALTGSGYLAPHPPTAVHATVQ
jgi:hypothetical protein